MKRLICIALALTLLVCGSACSASGGTYTDKEGKVIKHPIATITMENGSVIKVALYPENAPNTVANFISLANSGFYDGLIFHRVIYNFMIQGGDPEGTGSGASEYTIAGEFSENGIENDLSHVRGVISMARTNLSMDSACSQFFICHADSTFLDGKYAAFGMVIEGMDVVDEIARTTTNKADKPINDQVIKSITVNTFGHDYGEPDKMN